MSTLINHPIAQTTFHKGFGNLWAETSSLAMMLAEAAWMAAWYHAMWSTGVNRIAIFLGLAFALVGSHFLARGMQVVRLKMKYRRVVFILVLILFDLWTLKAFIYPQRSFNLPQLVAEPFLSILQIRADDGGVWHLLLIILLAWRGLHLASHPVELSRAQRSFQVGGLALMFFGMTASWTVTERSLLPLFAWLFLSVISLSTGRIYSLSQHQGGRLPPLSREWALGIGLFTIAVVGLALGIGWFSNAYVAEITGQILFILNLIVFGLAMLLVIPIVLLGIALMPWLADRLQNTLDTFAQNVAQTSIQRLFGDQPSGPVTLDQIMSSATALTLLAVLIILAALVLLGLRWRASRLQLQNEQEYVSVGGMRLINPFKARKLPEVRLRSPRQILAAARIRQIYTQLMFLSARLGLPRPPSKTPLEFIDLLTGLFKDNAADLTLITQAYQRVRYGELPETDAEVTPVIQAWERIRTAGREVAAEQRKNRHIHQKPA